MNERPGPNRRVEQLTIDQGTRWAATAIAAVAIAVGVARALRHSLGTLR
jgi:hypothetical protein